MKTVFSTICALALFGFATVASAETASSVGQTQVQCLQLSASEIPACLLDSWSSWLEENFGS
ncbi:MAG: hypothetical protein QM581_08060 [Pseudomonas sp.]